MPTVVVEEKFAGPPKMGHGGYVAGLFTRHLDGPIQATLRKPIPVDTDLDLVEAGDGRWELRHDGDVVAEAVSTDLMIDVPTPPTIDAAREAEAQSPSRFNGRGVHPTCFGCGLHRDDDEGLALAAGPVTVDGVDQVAAVWTPADRHDAGDGTAHPHWVLAALDCAGAFAYMVDDIRAGLLGRIVFDQYAPVAVGVEHVLTGWRIEIDGKKMFAGTALASGDGEILAAAKATWFGWS